MFGSRYMPCESCGESVDRSDLRPHECTPERRAEFEMFALRDEVAELVPLFEAYVGSGRGRFEVWLAAQQVRRPA